MSVPEYQMRATKKYQDAHYAFIKVRFTKEEAEAVRDSAKESGAPSLNAYLTGIILDHIAAGK